MVVGGWWLVVGGWWLVVGSWWLVVGGVVSDVVHHHRASSTFASRGCDLRCGRVARIDVVPPEFVEVEGDDMEDDAEGEQPDDGDADDDAGVADDVVIPAGAAVAKMTSRRKSKK